MARIWLASDEWRLVWICNSVFLNTSPERQVWTLNEKGQGKIRILIPKTALAGEPTGVNGSAALRVFRV